MDETSELNRSRLPEHNVRCGKCLKTLEHKYSPKRIKLPFFENRKHHEHSGIETPFIGCTRSHSHRTHPKRWSHKSGYHQTLSQPQPQPQRQYHNHRLNPHEDTASTNKHFSQKFSFTQHSNHLSRFYMIFVIFLIYLLDKTNCDQGEYEIYFTYTRTQNVLFI